MRRLILDAASREFAEKGKAGARIATIAREAKVNVQAIYYHFGNKDGLYQAVMQTIFPEERDFQLLFDDIGSMDPEVAIIRVIDFMFDQYSGNSTSAALLFEQEQKFAAKELAAMEDVRKLFGRLVHSIGDALRRGVDAGLFRSHVDATTVWLTITALTGGYVHKVKIHSALNDRDFSTETERKAWRGHVIDLLLAALRR